MAYLVDSDILIHSLKDMVVVQDHFRAKASIPKAISVISFGELLFGAKKSNQPQRNTAVVLRLAEIFPVVDVSRGIMEIFADLKASLQKKGAGIDDMDLLIGATALSLNYTLVTNNEKHFARIPGLVLENWTKSTPFKSI